MTTSAATLQQAQQALRQLQALDTQSLLRQRLERVMAYGKFRETSDR